MLSDFGQLLGSINGKGRHGRYWQGAPWLHYSNCLVMDVFEHGVKVSFPSWPLMGMMSDTFKWAEMKSLYLGPETVGWREVDGWKWMFSANDQADLAIFCDAVRNSGVAYDWRVVVVFLEAYLP